MVMLRCPSPIVTFLPRAIKLSVAPASVSGIPVDSSASMNSISVCGPEMPSRGRIASGIIVRRCAEMLFSSATRRSSTPPPNVQGNGPSGPSANSISVCQSKIDNRARIVDVLIADSYAETLETWCNLSRGTADTDQAVFTCRTPTTPSRTPIVITTPHQ